MKELPTINKIETGKNIKRLMKNAKMGTFELQKYLELTSPSSIYLWLRGEYVPNAESLVKLAYLFNCTVDEILIKEESDDEQTITTM